MDTGSAKNLLGQQGSNSSEVPLEHLDYDYIGDCAKIRELEKILKTLRSGKEGYYPDLIKFCEERIADIDPNSRILRQDKPPASKYDLGAEEWTKVNADIKDWTKDISQSGKAFNSKGDGDQKLPPVRKGATIDTQGKKQEDSKLWGQPSKDRIKSHDYRAWDKFDAEREAKKVEGVDDKGERLKEAAADIAASRSGGKSQDCINVEGMSDREREVVANREKDKGNEAFRSCDYEEAVTYYSRSISVIPSAPAFNNRALARIKLGQYREAATDCNKVLEIEPENIKAFLRRGTARKSLKEFQAARQDLEKVLTIEPHNKQAKDLLADLATKEAKAKKEQGKSDKERPSPADVKQKTAAKASSAEKPKGGRRLVIEEVEGSDSEEEEWEDAKQDVVNNHSAKSETDHKKGGDRNSELVNGVGDVKPSDKGGEDEEEKFMPARSAQESQVPIKGGIAGADMEDNDESDVIRNIPHEENQSSVNGHADAVDGGCMSRPAEDKGETAVDECEQNRLNSNSEVKSSQESTAVGEGTVHPKSEASKPQSANTQNGVKDEATGQTVAEETAPSVPPPVPKEERPLPAAVVALKDQALEFYKAGQYSDANEKFTQAISRLLPDKEEFGSALASLYSNRAACSLRTGETKACIKDCDDSLDLNPYNTKVLMRRGAAYEAGEKYRHAYVDFQQAVSLDPVNRVAQDACTRLVRLLRDEDGPKWREKLPARPTLPSLPKRPPILTTMAPSNAATPVNTTTTKSTMTTMTLGQGSEVKGQPKSKPEVAAQKAAEKKAEPILTKEERFQKLKDEGNTFFKTGSHAEAVKCYTACIETDPTQVASYTNRALCYLKLAQYAKAETDCSLALALDNNNIKALYRRALARKGLKEFKKSAQDLTTLLKHDNQNKEAKKELDLVKDLWRKELTAAKEESKPAKKGKTEKKPTRVHIEESDTDSNEEKENGTPVRPNQKSTSKAGKGSKGDKTATKDSQETEKQAKQQASSKKAGRPNSTKSATNTVPKLNKVTAYEFMQAWMSLKGTRNLAGYAELIKQVPPKELRKVLSNKLDGDMLGLILRATSEHLVEKDPANSYATLYNLIEVERFNTLVLFLTGKDKKSLRKALDYLESVKCDAYTAEDVKKLRQNYAL